MAHLYESIAALRVSGDDLIPEQISQLLGSTPTTSQIKGQMIQGPKTGQERVAKSGLWVLEATDCKPAELNKQVAELLSGLTQDLGVWTSISEQFTVDLFCGFFLATSDEGISVFPETLLSLGQRGIALELSIYGPHEEQNK